MLEDYENVLLVLNDKHLDLKEAHPEYATLANEREMETAQVLEVMIDFLNQNQLVKQKETGPSLESSVNLDDSSIIFKPGMSFTPTRFKGESVLSSSGKAKTETHTSDKNSSPGKSTDMNPFESPN